MAAVVGHRWGYALPRMTRSLRQACAGSGWTLSEGGAESRMGWMGRGYVDERKEHAWLRPKMLMLITSICGRGVKRAPSNQQTRPLKSIAGKYLENDSLDVLPMTSS